MRSITRRHDPARETQTELHYRFRTGPGQGVATEKLNYKTSPIVRPKKQAPEKKGCPQLLGAVRMNKTAERTRIEEKQRTTQRVSPHDDREGRAKTRARTNTISIPDFIMILAHNISRKLQMKQPQSL